MFVPWSVGVHRPTGPPTGPPAGLPAGLPTGPPAGLPVGLAACSPFSRVGVEGEFMFTCGGCLWLFPASGQLWPLNRVFSENDTLKYQEGCCWSTRQFQTNAVGTDLTPHTTLKK